MPIALHTDPAVPNAWEGASPRKESPSSSSSLGSKEVSTGVVALDLDKNDVPGDVPSGVLVAECCNAPCLEVVGVC